jgi:hypothetical protein
MRPVGNDDALLRWNACARMIGQPSRARQSEEMEPMLVVGANTASSRRRSGFCQLRVELLRGWPLRLSDLVVGIHLATFIVVGSCRSAGRSLRGLDHEPVQAALDCKAVNFVAAWRRKNGSSKIHWSDGSTRKKFSRLVW